MLFNSKTSLPKGYGLIEHFSEDIDITIFSEDIGQPAAVVELEILSGSVPARLDATRTACHEYIVIVPADEDEIEASELLIYLGTKRTHFCCSLAGTVANIARNIFLGFELPSNALRCLREAGKHDAV